MPSSKLPSGLKSALLKQIAFLMGLPTAGTKAELNGIIIRSLRDPPLLSRPTRIVSIDMGIKNLGICALETPGIMSSANTGHAKSSLKVVAWKKLDVLKSITSTGNTTTIGDEGSALTQLLKSARKRPAPALSPSTFTPSSLSKIALSVAQDLLRTYNPTHILIERQRFRSGGAAAVQEWTLRVNMLESMIWACLESLRVGKESFPAVHEVSPARVAKFWCLGPSTIGTTPPLDLFAVDRKDTKTLALANEVSRKTSKIEKKDKIAVVKSWLDEDKSENGDSTVALELSDEAMVVADSFLPDGKGSRSGKTSTPSSGKLDDLADCLLQGAAWVRWEENRQRILQVLNGEYTATSLWEEDASAHESRLD